MIFALDFIVLVLILRASVVVGYYPVFWGVINGMLNTVLSLAHHGIGGALTQGAISGGLCAALLYVLSLVDGRPIIWWIVLASGFIIPLVSGAFS